MTSAAVMSVVGVVLSLGAKLLPSDKVQEWMARLGYWQSALMAGLCVGVAVVWWALGCFTTLTVPPTGLDCGFNGAIQAVAIGVVGWMANQASYASAIRRL